MAGQWVIEDDAPKGQWVIEDAPAAAASSGKPNYSIQGEGWNKIQNYSGKDSVAGAVRGAGSIGSTLMAPIDAGLRAVGLGDVPFLGANDRRAQLDPALKSMGANPDSNQYQAAKLAAEVAGTSGMGGLLGGAISKIPGAVTALPTLLPAIQSGGMVANGVKGIEGLIARVVGGAVNGAATAGLVNPADADTGAALNGAMPIVTKGLGAAGRYIGSPPAPGVNPTTMLTAKDGMAAGYIVPPNMLQPSLKNQVIESISGKQATQQIASMKNSEVTEKLVRKSLGIADDVPLTQSTMENLRKTAGKAYADVSALSPQAAADLEALKIARNESQGWFKAYNRSARPDDLAQAKAFKAQADALETGLEAHAKAAGQTSLIPDLRAARKAIAKTYTVGRALNDASGTVDARILGRMSEKGLPLSDGLDVAGKFASAFPTITKTPMQVGSPASHNLKAGMSALMGGGGLAALGPMGVAAAAVPFIAPPMARSIMFSNRAQSNLLNSGQGGVMRGLLDDGSREMAPLLYRSGGLLAGGR